MVSSLRGDGSPRLVPSAVDCSSGAPFGRFRRHGACHGPVTAPPGTGWTATCGRTVTDITRAPSMSINLRDLQSPISSRPGLDWTGHGRQLRLQLHGTCHMHEHPSILLKRPISPFGPYQPNFFTIHLSVKADSLRMPARYMPHKKSAERPPPPDILPSGP